MSWLLSFILWDCIRLPGNGQFSIRPCAAQVFRSRLVSYTPLQRLQDTWYSDGALEGALCCGEQLSEPERQLNVWVGELDPCGVTWGKMSCCHVHVVAQRLLGWSQRCFPALESHPSGNCSTGPTCLEPNRPGPHGQAGRGLLLPGTQL